MPSKIEWCEETFNPITGCTPISEGCQNCYAKRMANRLRGRYGYPADEPFRPGVFHPEQLEKPLNWKKPRRIFVCSMGDLFHEDVWGDHIAAVLGIAAFCQEHTFLLLTKKPQAAHAFFKDFHLQWWMNEVCRYLPNRATKGIRLRPSPKSLPLPNVWLGVTAENQQRADERTPILMQIPAAVRFVSVEPMLSAVDLTLDAGTGEGHRDSYFNHGLDWVICGGETGPGARPMHPDWARSLRDQCQAAGVPFFFKKHGAGDNSRLLDGREWNEYPA